MLQRRTAEHIFEYSVWRHADLLLEISIVSNRDCNWLNIRREEMINQVCIRLNFACEEITSGILLVLAKSERNLASVCLGSVIEEQKSLYTLCHQFTLRIALDIF